MKYSLVRHSFFGFALLFSFVSHVSCVPKKSENSASKAFVPGSFDPNRIPVSDFKLARVDALNSSYSANKESTISYKAEKMKFKPPAEVGSSGTGRGGRDSGRGGREPAAEPRTIEAANGQGLDELSDFHLVVTVGPLDRMEQYNDLMKIYGGEGNVPFVSGKVYQLTDFLNPKMQALMGKQFSNQREILSPEKIPDINGRGEGSREVSQVTNCFQAAYEALRGGTDPLYTFFPDAQEYDAFMKNPVYSTEIKKLTLEERKPDGQTAQRNAGLQPGDAIMIYGPVFIPGDGMVAGKELSHIAVFLDDDLYFEKTGPFSSHLYRTVSYKEMVSPMAYSVKGSFELTDIRVRRFSGKPRLPAAPDVFSLVASKSEVLESAKNIVSSQPDKPQWSVITPDLANELNVVSQTGLGGGRTLWFYRIKAIPLEIDQKSNRYKVGNSALLPEAFWL